MDSWVELSVEDVREKSLELARIIETECTPDCVVFVAKAGYLIGETIATYFNLPLYEMTAQREGGGIKKLLSPFLRLIPRKLKIHLRSKELYSGIHNAVAERTVRFDNRRLTGESVPEKILLVDDSVDTGHTIVQCRGCLQAAFPESQIFVCALNVWDKSLNIVHVDFSLWKNKIVIGPWSNDSKEVKVHNRLYLEWKETH